MLMTPKPTRHVLSALCSAALADDPFPPHTSHTTKVYFFRGVLA